MATGEQRISIDNLIKIVESGGKIRTGVDIFNKQGRLILDKGILVSEAETLFKVKRFGIKNIPIVSAKDGGLWDKNGNPVELLRESGPKASTATSTAPQICASKKLSELDRKVSEIRELKAAAGKKYKQAKGCIKKIITEINASGGEFDFSPVEETVSDLFGFISANESAFSYLTKEIFSYDDYLYNHSINVCTIGTVVVKKFNDSFSAMVNNAQNSSAPSSLHDSFKLPQKSFIFLMKEELKNISIGFFMHDLGKVLLDQTILNKPGRLTPEEFEIVKSHSTCKGIELMERNNLSNPFIHNISLYHHATLFEGEERCYPDCSSPSDLPAYVKICKLADIYDAMTSKRSYKEAFNPVAVVADLFHKYAEKDRLLQYILHSFVNSVGIYPPGSVVTLNNGQLAYIFDSSGPTILQITDTRGQTLKKQPELLVLGDKEVEKSGLCVDRHKAPMSPLAAYDVLPEYLRKTIDV